MTHAETQTRKDETMVLKKSYWMLRCGFTAGFDEEYENLVGKDASGGGCGSGVRDLDWEFQRKDTAFRAGKRLSRKKRIVYVSLDRYVGDEDDPSKTITLKDTRGETMKAKDRKDWQADPRGIKTNQVQIWSADGTMKTGRCPRSEARRLVARGKAFVMTDQAIGMCD